jgi:hypothetical protein
VSQRPSPFPPDDLEAAQLDDGQPSAASMSWRAGRTGQAGLTRMFAINGASAAPVAPVRPADMRQAEYYKTLLDQQRGQVDEDIAHRYTVLATSQANADLRGMRQVRKMIRQMQGEQFELDCLRAALEHRFFPALAAPTSPAHCFDVEIAHHRSWWRIDIPAITELTRARHRGDVEMRAREQIALKTGIPIIEVAVAVFE